jgi:hypothetical protein
MKFMKPFVLTAFLFFVVSNSAVAETAEEMLASCRLVANAPVREGRVILPSDERAHECWGAFGVIQELSRQLVAGNPLPMFSSSCIPDGMRRTELAAIFVSYVDKHPERRQENFTYLVLAAFAEAYPCKS